LHLKKNLPVASGLGGGSADAAAALRLLTRLWSIDPAHAAAVAPELGSDVPACLISMTARGGGAGDELELLDDPGIAGTPVLLVNPRIPLSTTDVFAKWDGADRGPLGDWRDGRNDLEGPAISLVPQVAEILDWLQRRPGADFVRMSGSGATCFALFDSDESCDAAAEAVPDHWWHLATHLR
jgi:4-diphosphocytidyl-2-C-methyl-D-erythritol kinase